MALEMYINLNLDALRFIFIEMVIKISVFSQKRKYVSVL